MFKFIYFNSLLLITLLLDYKLRTTTRMMMEQIHRAWAVVVQTKIYLKSSVVHYNYQSISVSDLQ